MPSLDAVDTPLRTVALDTLKDVAVRDLTLKYRLVVLGATRRCIVSFFHVQSYQNDEYF